VSRIVVNIKDERKAKRFFALLCDLDYVDAQVEDTEKVWNGNLPVFNNPVFLPEFTIFSREELCQ